MRKVKLRMKSINEPVVSQLIYTLVPVVICAGHFVMLTTIFIIIIKLSIFTDISIYIMITAIIFIIIIFKFWASFWYKTFFDPRFVGPDRPLAVHWTDDRVQFIGAFFNLDIPVNDIISYRRFIFSFRPNQSYMLNVRVIYNGKMKYMSLSTTMPQKEKFIEYLQSHIAVVR